jgi:hypothetical protein
MVRLLKKDEAGWMGKEAVVAYFRISGRHVPQYTEERHGKPESWKPMCELRFKPHTFWEVKSGSLPPEPVYSVTVKIVLWQWMWCIKQNLKILRLTGFCNRGGLCLLRGTFCPHSVFMCFVWIWVQTAIITLYSINWLVFITETECVYCAVRTW